MLVLFSILEMRITACCSGLVLRLRPFQQSDEVSTACGSGWMLDCSYELHNAGWVDRDHSESLFENHNIHPLPQAVLTSLARLLSNSTT